MAARDEVVKSSHTHNSLIQLDLLITKTELKRDECKSPWMIPRGNELGYTSALAYGDLVDRHVLDMLSVRCLEARSLYLKIPTPLL